MKKTLTLAVLGVLLTSKALAGTLTFAWGAGNDHSLGGGEFELNTSANGKFNSFCIEDNEYIALGPTYYYSISGGAVRGGFSGGNPDMISIGSAYLYRTFHDGTLANYTHTAQNQNDLQEAFWWLEGEIGPGTGNRITYNPASNPFLAAADLALPGNLAALQADGNGAYGVRAMNIYNDASHTQPAQDQLIVVPDGGMSLTMLGMACASLGLMRRKLTSL